MTQNKISIAFQTNKSAGEYVALAKLVNQFPFENVSVYNDLPFHPSYGPLLLMAPYLERAKIGPAAVSPYRMHPFDIAANAALLASTAKAGTYIGLARGAWLNKYGFAEGNSPIQGIEESIIIIRKLLRGEKASFHGRTFSMHSDEVVGYPLAQELPDFLIGTWGKKLAGVASKNYVQEVKIGGTANPLMITKMQEYLNSANPNAITKIVVGAVTVLDEDRKSARKKAKSMVAVYIDIVGKLDPTINIDPGLLKVLNNFVSIQDYESAAENISDNLLEKFAFAGNVEDIVFQIQSCFEAGASRVELGTPHGLNQGMAIKEIGEKIIPQIR